MPHPAAGLRIDEAPQADATLLELTGDLDVLTAPRLRVHLADVVRRCEGDVVIDMAGVTFIDSTGLAAMLNALRRLTRARRRLAIACPEQGPVHRILRLTRLEGTFTVCESADQALERLGARQATL